MNTELSRRSFIKTTAGLAVSAGFLEMESTLQAASQTKWPVGCRDLHLKVTGATDPWAAMKALGAEGVEVDVTPDMGCPNLFGPRKYNLGSAEGIQQLQQDVASSSGRITAFMMSNRFDERLEQELEWTRKLVKAAQQLGVRVIRIDVVPRKIARSEFLPFAIKACKQLCAVADGTGIRFGVENHSNTTNDPEFLSKLFAGVDSNTLGLTLDCANFYWWGHPESALYGIYERFAPRVVHTHCKSIKYPLEKRNIKREMGWEYAKYNCPIYEGDIDFKRLIAILQKANYQGDLCIEDESLGKQPPEQRTEVLRKEIAFLKQLE